MADTPPQSTACHNSWLEINLDAIEDNIRTVRQFVGPQTRVMAILKADGYGHGAIPVARAVARAGAAWLGVASAAEGAQLREAGVETPILILGAGFPEQAQEVVHHRLSQAVANGEVPEALSRAAVRAGTEVGVQIKVDTGMGRLGVMPHEVVPFARRLLSLPGLRLEGVFSHLATAEDEDTTFALEQFARFQEALGALEEAGIPVPMRHIANSAAALNFPQMHLDLVRPGLLGYGITPPGARGAPDLRPALAWKSRIAFVKRVPAGTSLSYGRTYVTARETTVATLPVGYADGYCRLLSNRGIILVRGKHFPVAGRVCMDHILLDMGDEPDLHASEEAVLIGRQEGAEITANELADAQGTVVHEVVARLGKRLPRIYLTCQPPPA
jgi:alanine racemase